MSAAHLALKAHDFRTRAIVYFDRKVSESSGSERISSPVGGDGRWSLKPRIG